MKIIINNKAQEETLKMQEDLAVGTRIYGYPNFEDLFEDEYRLEFEDTYDEDDMPEWRKAYWQRMSKQDTWIEERRKLEDYIIDNYGSIKNYNFAMIKEKEDFEKFEKEEFERIERLNRETNEENEKEYAEIERRERQIEKENDELDEKEYNRRYKE